MVVESAAIWRNDLQKWEVRADLEAHQSMWDVPFFDWSFQGVDFESGELAGGVGVGYKKATVSRLFDPPTGTRLDKSSVITLEVSDHSQYDTLKADNKYIIHWRMPYEAWFEFRPWEDYWQIPPVVDGQPSEGAAWGFNYQFKWNTVSPRWGDFVDQAPIYLGAAADIIPNPVISAICALISLGVNQLDDGWVEESVNFAEHWDNPESEFLDPKDDSPDLQDRWRMTAVAKIGMRHYFFEAEEYNSHGYVGQKRKTINVEDGRKRAKCTYRLKDGPVGPPNPNG